MDNEGSEDIQSMVLTDVTPISLGIEVEGGKMSFVVNRNAQIPAHEIRPFTTCEDNQTSVRISIYEGEDEKVKNNRILGEFALTGITPLPKEEAQIMVSFDLDFNGILEVNAWETASGKRKKIQIVRNKPYNLTIESNLD